MIKAKHVCVTLILIVALGAIFIGTVSTPIEEKGALKIGAILILSGDAAVWGENAKRGIELAIQEFEETSDREIKLIIEDTGSDTKRVISAYRKLVDIDKVDAIVGPLRQTDVAALAPLAAKDGIPVFAPSDASQEDRPNLKNPLLVWMNPTVQAQRMAEYVFEEGIQTVGVIGTIDSWEQEVSDAFAEAFAMLGGRVTAKEIVQTETTDIRSSITKILTNEPEAVFVGTFYQFIQVTKTLAEMGYKGRVYSMEVDSYLAESSNPFSNGVQFISPDFYQLAFVEAFEKKCGQPPGIPAGQAYDVTKILLSFFEQCGSRECVLEMMENFSSYEGASGLIEATEDGRTVLPTAIFEIQDGEIVRIGEAKQSY